MASRATDHDAHGAVSIGQLAASIKDDLSGLVRDEIELAKAEMRANAKSAATGAALAAAAAFLLLLALILASIAAAHAVAALGLSRGWAFLVVAGGYVLVAFVLLLVAKSSFSRLSKPERSTKAAQRAARSLRPSPREP